MDGQQCLFQLMADQKKGLLDQIQVNKKLWELVVKSVVKTERNPSGGSTNRGTSPAIKVQKMTPADDLEA